jgi:methylated-DNA-[protein]-cysteine S-methyltransferase
VRTAPQTTDLPTPFGVVLRVTVSSDAVIEAEFVAKRAQAVGRRQGLLHETAAQVRAYFARRLRRFDLPLEFAGTPFQHVVWRTVADLAFGEIVSYADVARAVGKPLAHRGVAAAMRATPIDLFIAAHRVIGADGRVHGCGPRSVRARLLAFERTPTAPRRSPARR